MWKDLAELTKIVNDYNVNEIFIGLPGDLTGDMGQKG